MTIDALNVIQPIAQLVLKDTSMMLLRQESANAKLENTSIPETPFVKIAIQMIRSAIHVIITIA
jgi:hypothetical protein